MINDKNWLSRILFKILIIISIYPIIILIFMAFFSNWSWPSIIPKGFNLRGIQYVLDIKGHSFGVLIYSILLSIIVTIITLIVSVPAGRALGIYNFKFKNLVKLIILAPIIVPSVSIGLGIHIEFLKLGIANTFWGVVMIHIMPCIPYAVRIISDVFEIMGEELEQQARVLGASKIKSFYYVTLPILMPALASASFLVFIVSFSQYFLTFLIGGGKVITYSILMFPFIQSGDKGIAASFSLIFLVTSLMMLFAIDKILKKHYKSGEYFYL